MNSEIYIKGIVTVNFDMAIDRKKFSQICEGLGLDANKYQDFTESQWVALRGKLVDEIYVRPGDIEIIDACDQTAMLDQIDFLDDEHYEVMFNTDGTSVQSIEKDCESLTVKL